MHLNNCSSLSLSPFPLFPRPIKIFFFPSLWIWRRRRRRLQLCSSNLISDSVPRENYCHVTHDSRASSLPRSPSPSSPPHATKAQKCWRGKKEQKSAGSRLNLGVSGDVTFLVRDAYDSSFSIASLLRAAISGSGSSPFPFPPLFPHFHHQRHHLNRAEEEEERGKKGIFPFSAFFIAG